MARTQMLRPGVYLITTDNWRLNSGLIVGTERAMVIDTGAGPRQGREILAAVREITKLPLMVVNTHAHYDHYMGNAVFKRAGVEEFWSHKVCATTIERDGDDQRTFVLTQEPEMGENAGPDTQFVLPTHTLPGNGLRPALRRFDLGERPVTMFFLGPAHTDHDVCIGVEDVVFCGDIVEEGSDPSFEDSYPQHWVNALRALTTLERYEMFIPGHGNPVTRTFVQQQSDTMELAVERVRNSKRPQDENPTTASMYRLPYQGGVARVFLDRLAVIERASEATGPQPTS